MGLTENVQGIYNSFAGIKAAIEGKGVTVPANTPVTEYAGLIDDIPTGGGGVIDAQADWSYMFANNKRLTLVNSIGNRSSHVTDWQYCFNSSTNLTSITTPFDMSSAQDCSYMFNGCRNLTSIGALDLSNIEKAENMFYNCSNLEFTSVLDLSGLTGTNPVRHTFMYGGKRDTSIDIYLPSTVDINSMFRGCYFNEINIVSSTKVTNLSFTFSTANRLTTITGLDLSECTTYSSAFSTNHPLENISFAAGSTIADHAISFSGCANLTHTSLMNIINALCTGASSTCTLGSANLAKLTAEEQAIATAKGWTLA